MQSQVTIPTEATVIHSQHYSPQAIKTEDFVEAVKKANKNRQLLSSISTKSKQVAFVGDADVISSDREPKSRRRSHVEQQYESLHSTPTYFELKKMPKDVTPQKATKRSTQGSSLTKRNSSIIMNTAPYGVSSHSLKPERKKKLTSSRS